MTLKQRLGSVVIPMLPVNRRTFNILRHELNGLRRLALNFADPGHRRAVRQLQKQKNLSVNVGSGGKGLPGWVNIELNRMRDTTLCLDIRQSLPLADQSVARLLAEHVVEHIDFRHDLPSVLADWHRVLQPGGTLRIVVPDASRFLKAYASGDSKQWQDLGWSLDRLPSDIYTPMHVVNHIFHQSGEHLFAYDFETLAWALRQAGFNRIEQKAYQQSGDPQLAIDQPNHAAHSLYVEAVR